jgi:hypothetical protein
MVDVPVSIILHINARAHTADAVTGLLRCWRWEIPEHPPYSADMRPCSYDLFVKIKEPHKYPVPQEYHLLGHDAMWLL